MDFEKFFESILITSTLVLFIYTVIAYPYDLSFSNSFLWNLIEVPLYLAGSALVVAAFVFIPSFPIYLLQKKLDSLKENGEHKTANVLLVTVCALVVFVLALFVHSRNI